MPPHETGRSKRSTLGILGFLSAAWVVVFWLTVALDPSAYMQRNGQTLSALTVVAPVMWFIVLLTLVLYELDCYKRLVDRQRLRWSIIMVILPGLSFLAYYRLILRNRLAGD